MMQGRLPGLGRHVAQQQDRLLAANVADERTRRSIAERVVRRSSTARLPKLRIAGAMMAAAAIVGVFLFLRPKMTADTALSFTIGEPPRSGVLGEWVSAPPSKALPVRFSDGTRVALEANARGRVIRVTPKGAEVLVEAGSANVSVVPRPAADWRVRTGPFVVRVTGTRFDVGWDPDQDRFHLELYEGKVIVSGCVFGDGQPVTAGHRVTASCRGNSLSVTSLNARNTTLGPAPPGSSVAAVASPPELSEKTEAEAKGVTSARRDEPRRAGVPAASPDADSRSWQELARNGLFERAYELAAAVGFERECERGSAAEVLLLGDAARLTGRSSSARQAYAAVRRRFPGSGEASRAAFDLGRLDFAGNPRSALAWLDTYLAEQPGGALAAAALGRKMEAYVALGQSDAAKSAAQSYLEHYSTGAHADYARQVLGARR